MPAVVPRRAARGVRGRPRRRQMVLVSLLLLLCWSANAGTYALRGSAFVGQDGSLRIHRQTVHLWGVLWVDTPRDCLPQVRPVHCGPRAVLALEQAITGFVRCTERGRRRDGSLVGQCYTGYSALSPGEDLAAWLLQRGWVAAAPDAPPAYAVLERIARHRGLGLWGLPAGLMR